MNPNRGFLPLILAMAVLAALLGVALLEAPVGIAQDASPAASPEACPSGTPAASPAASPAADATPCPEATPGAGGEGVSVEAGDIYFAPEEITIPADTDVTVTISNVGMTLHTFTIDELDIDIEIEPGATGEATINAPAGEYEYYCSVPGHRAAGQVGILIVE